LRDRTALHGLDRRHQPFSAATRTRLATRACAYCT
jgi:hypothetical protein